MSTEEARALQAEVRRLKHDLAMLYQDFDLKMDALADALNERLEWQKRHAEETRKTQFVLARINRWWREADTFTRDDIDRFYADYAEEFADL